MAFIPTPNVARVSIEGMYATAPIVNTLWFSKATPFNTADLDALLAALDTAWAAHMLAHLSPDYETNVYRAWAQDSDTAPATSLVPGTARVGTDSAGGDLSAQAALCITHHTSDRGRSARGRTYIGGICSAHQVDVQHLDGSYVSAVVGAFVSIRGACATAGYTFVVVSHQHNKVTLSQGVARTVVTSSANTRIDTIRNRLGN